MKKVKIITIVLAIILITMVAFFGVYIKTQNRMENKVKDYLLGRELEGARQIELKISDGDEENKLEQSADILTVENYEIVKKSIENRLNALGADDYTISLNKSNGTIIVELAEDERTDSYAYYLTASNKVQIAEKDSKTVLLSDSMVKKATYNYTADAEGYYQIYMELQLNNEGQAKVQEISQNYAILATEIDEIEAAQEEKEEESEKEDTTTEKEAKTENIETEKNEENVSEKKIAVLTIAGSEYDITKIEKNILTVNIGGKTANNTSINNNTAKAAELTMLINTGKYPVEYEIENNRYIYSSITKTELMYFALSILAIIFVILVILTIKYKIPGLLSSIACIGFISIFSLILRYTNVLITIEGIGAIILTIAINIKLVQSILSKVQKINLVNEAVNNTYKELFLKLVPVMIIVITFCFSGWTNLSSFGMIMFWGLILIAVYNIIITKTLLKLRENK